MKFKKKFVLNIVLMACLFFVCVHSYAASQNITYVLWQHKPLAITLPPSGQKMIRFVNPVAVGLPNSLQHNVTVDNQAGEVVFHVNKPFAITRVEVKDTVTGNVMILLLSTSKSGSSVPLDILYQKPAVHDDDNAEGWLKTPDALQGEIAYLTLTRYAEQQLYAPKRLQNNKNGIQLVESYVTPNGGIKPNTAFHTLFYDNSTINIPWTTWRGGNTYVTAVLVRNMLSTPINLTRALPLLCGHDNGVFKAVTFFPSWTLQKAGSAHDTTVAFLVTTIPFHQALQSCEVSHG